MITKDSVNVKMPVEEAPAESFNLDGILSELGSFGKYQLFLLLLLAFRDSFLAMCNFNFVFTAADVPHRCLIPECDVMDDSFNASWRSFALPNSSAVCVRAAPAAPAPHPRNLSAPLCSPQLYDQARAQRCDRLVYEDYNSVVAEFDLGCEPWKRTLIGTVHNLGLVFSNVLSGLISDRYGRKVVIVCSPLVVGVMGLIKSFSVSYWMLLACEFLETALGYGSTSMVLSLETVSQQRRVVFSCLWDSLSQFGSAFFGLIAWQVPYWRSLMRAIYAPLLVTVFYIFLVDESVRWLLVHDRRAEAVKVLNKVAKYNNITLSNKTKEMLTSISEQAVKVDQAREPRPCGMPLVSALRSRRVCLCVVLVAAQLFCCSFVFSGVMINSATISGNRYINFAALHLVAIPTRILTALTLTHYGRRAPVCCAYLLCSIFFITSGLVPKSASWSSLLFYLCGKMASSYGIFAVSVMAMEAFPTTSRNSLFNMAQLFGRLGAVLAPQAPLLEQYMYGLPSVMFGVVALGPALLALLMPDTSRAALPDHVEDAERLDDRPAQQDRPAEPTAKADLARILESQDTPLPADSVNSGELNRTAEPQERPQLKPDASRPDELQVKPGEPIARPAKYTDMTDASDNHTNQVARF